MSRYAMSPHTAVSTKRFRITNVLFVRSDPSARLADVLGIPDQRLEFFQVQMARTTRQVAHLLTVISTRFSFGHHTGSLLAMS
jgi:hypothetical protein